jgi:hypothetical protein
MCGEKLDAVPDVPTSRILTSTGRAWVAIATVLGVAVTIAIHVTRRFFG